jgi:predicted outer membrane repeat protein
LEVESCNFTDNFIDVVSPKNGGPSYGGALHATLRQQTSTATFTKSLFQRNKAVGGASESLDGAGGGNGLGGAVSLISTTLWQFNECLFFSNSAAGGIGAALGGSGTGGAIHYQSDTAEIAHTSAGVALYGSIFKDNLVRSGSTFHIGYAGSPAHGGAIAYNFQATSYVQVVQVVQCSFISNKAESKQGGNAGGGAMFVIRNRQIELDPFVQVSFVNTSFIDNVVKNTEGIDQAGASTGGALHLQIIGTSHFINQVFFQNVQFVGNHIDNSVSSGQGGALFMSSPVGGPKASPIQMLDCMFTANVVGLKESNLVHNSGAAMYLTTGVNMLVRRTTFRSNTVIAATILSTSCGGAIFSTYQIASEECTFYGNSVVSELSRAAGGAVCVGYWFKATNTVFRRNFARGKVVFGGAISGVLSQDPSQIQGVLLVNSTFDDNSLMVTDGGDGLGGSIYSHGFPFQVHNSTISNSHIVNEQQQSMFGSGGGAIACEAKMPFALNNVRIENCYAPNGGALYITNTRSFYAGILSNNQFINNRASLSGGAIFVHHNTFQNSSYIDYLCPVFDSRVTIEENNEFINNTAVYGVDCGFLPLEISFLHQPENIWPGLIFSLTFVQVDFLGDIIIAPMEFQLLPSSSKFGVALTTGLVYDKVIPNNGGIYRYNMLQTTLPTGSTIQVVLMTPTLLVNNVTVRITPPSSRLLDG